MSRLTIYKENVSDSITLSNQFIDEYLPQANDAQIKVYLYLLRMMGASLPTSISDIADRFNHTERDVIRALSYWEKLGLLVIEYDASGEICGLQLPSGQEKERSAGSGQVMEGTERVAQILPLPVDKTRAESAYNDTSGAEKRDYSVEELNEMKKQESFANLLFATETYFKRPLTLSDLQVLAFIKERLQFGDELMEYLVEYCVGRDHRDMHYIEKVAVAWAQAGIKTVRQAKNRSSRYDKIVYSVMRELGRGQNDVTQTEADYILRWYHEYGFSEDVILYACNKCVLATDRNRIVYTEGILRNWRESGLKTLSQIQKAEQKKQAGQEAQQRRSVSVARTSKSRIEERPIDYDSLEKELLKYQ